MGTSRTVIWVLGFVLGLAGCLESNPQPSPLGPGDDWGDDARVTAADMAGPDRGLMDDMEPQEDVAPPVYAPVVFTVVSDIHLNGGLDSSISQNVVGLFEEAAGLTPAPEFMVVTGDLADCIPEPASVAPGTPLHALRTIFREGPLPVEAIAGNHDYYSSVFPALTLVDDRDARDQLLEEVLEVPRWTVTEHGGTRFIYVNTMQGDLWDISDGLNGSAGREQLEWLDGLLSDGRPAVVFMHHPPSTVLEDDEITVEATLAAHQDNVLAVFAGHLHLWGYSDDAGIPIYLTDEGWDGEGIHHVRVDPEAGTVEILNAASIDYGEPEVLACDPGQETALGDLSMFDGALLELIITDSAATPEGFGVYLEEAVSMVPLVFAVGAPDPSGLALPARLAAGRFVGEGVPGKPPFVDALADSVPIPMSLAVDDPCFSTSPVVLTFDLGQAFGFPMKPGWTIRVDFLDLRFEGRLNGGPGISDGHLHATVDLAPGAADVKNIIISEYCAGAIVGCTPGAGDMPACPDLPDLGFFDEIPVSCDVSIWGIGIRMVLAMIETVPESTAWLDANFITYAAKSGPGAPGEVDPAMFADPAE